MVRTGSTKMSEKRAAKSAESKRSAGGAAPDVSSYICNLTPSTGTDRDWRFADSVAANVMAAPVKAPSSYDLRAAWWGINDQQNTGSCVGWAVADGLVRYQLVAAGRLAQDVELSPRHVWMASKETDVFVSRPQTFIEQAGTSLKDAVRVTQKHGVALMSELPFHIDSAMYGASEAAFYTSCAQRRVGAYFNLRRDLTQWRNWLVSNGPILVGLNVDESWDRASANGGRISTFKPATTRGGHAVCVVGYRTDGRFIVRNSWGTAWGDEGFGYVSPSYIAAAFFDESYGVTLAS